MNEPLGLGAGLAIAAPPQGRALMATGAVAALATVLCLFALERLGPSFRHEPSAIAKVEVAPAPVAAPAPAAPAPAEASASASLPPAPPIASADQIEAASGVKVTRVGGGGPPNALIIDVDRALAAQPRP